MVIKTIYVGGDHAGFKLKEKLKPWLEKEGYKVEDLGPRKYNKIDDYPDFVVPLARKVSKDKSSRGIIIAGSGMGEAMATNKIKGIRAALYHGKNTKIVVTSRVHDNSNILSIGSRFLDLGEAKKAINIFLKTPFAGGRHKRRLDKFNNLGGR